MTQGRFERVGFHFARKVIPSRTKIPSSDNRSRRDFAFQVEVVLQRVWELWMVGGLKNVQRLRQKSTLRIEKAGKYIGTNTLKGRQKPINTKQDKGELIAKHARSAP